MEIPERVVGLIAERHLGGVVSKDTAQPKCLFCYVEMVTIIEHLVRVYFSFVFPNEEVLYNHRPDWLKNPKTGNNLELDVYYPKLKIACEANGIAHGLAEQKKRDRYKRKVCRKKGILLISIMHPAQLLSSDNTYLLSQKSGKKITREELPQKLKQVMWGYQPKKSSFGTMVRRRVNAQNKRKKIRAKTEEYNALQRKENELGRLRMQAKKRAQ